MSQLQDNVVVITGASSGIGRASALEFARHGCKLLLAARREEDLEEVACLCREEGGEAHPCPTDVSHEEEVHRLAEAALARYGRIDVWVNNAGVTAFGKLTEIPAHEHRRVFETNVFGAIYGAQAVIPVFRRQQRGTLINVSSTLGRIGQPYVPSYSMSKFALRGLSECLRVELANEPDIHVCTLLPYTVDTQHFQSGANAVGGKAYALPPMQSTEKVARALVDLARRPRRERLVPGITALGLAFHSLLPNATERLLLDALERWHFGDEPDDELEGNLDHPSHERGETHGDRAPRVGTPRFALWAAGRFVRNELRATRRWLAAPRPEES